MCRAGLGQNVHGLGPGRLFWARSKLYYTAAHTFGIVIMALDSVFMRFDVNDNFFENNVLFWKTKGGGIFVSINTLLRINVA